MKIQRIQKQTNKKIKQKISLECWNLQLKEIIMDLPISAFSSDRFYIIYFEALLLSTYRLRSEYLLDKSTPFIILLALLLCNKLL